MAEEQIAVVFSPPQFKALVTTINTAIAAYERQFGAITLPGGFGSTKTATQAREKEGAAQESTKKR